MRICWSLGLIPHSCTCLMFRWSRSRGMCQLSWSLICCRWEFSGNIKLFLEQNDFRVLFLEAAPPCHALLVQKKPPSKSKITVRGIIRLWKHFGGGRNEAVGLILSRLGHASGNSSHHLSHWCFAGNKCWLCWWFILVAECSEAAGLRSGQLKGLFCTLRIQL